MDGPLDVFIGYQVYWKSFWGGRGASVGNLNGLRLKLAYLASLGIDTLWVVPGYESPQADNGYDVSDYTKLDSRFATMGEFLAFLDEAHALGIRVIMDLPGNHTSHLHPWFRDALRSPGSPYRSWYVFRPGKPNGEPPNRWVSVFGETNNFSVWSPVRGEEGMWYLHTFLPEQPDLDWHNLAVREAILEVLRFWLDKGVDGFRLDYVPPIGKDRALRDSPENPEWVPGMPNRRRCTVLYSEFQDDMYLYLDELVRAVALTHPRALIITEAYPPKVDEDPLAYMRFYNEIDATHSAPFDFGLMFVKWDAKTVGAYLKAFYKALPAGALAIWANSNHDNVRPATVLGEAQAMVALGLLLSLPGLPFIYQGQEINLKNGERPVGGWPFVDPDDRNGERGVLPWTDEPGGGWLHPWLPTINSTASVEAQLNDPASALNRVKALIALRRATPALQRGEYVQADSGNDAVLRFGVRYGGDEVTVLLNYSHEPQEVDTEGGPKHVLFSMTGRTDASHETLTLEPDEMLILR